MTTDPALRALDLAQKLGYDLVNDHRGIPYDVIERVDEIAAALAAAEAAPGTSFERQVDRYCPRCRARVAAEAAPLDVERLAAADARVMTKRKLPYWMPSAYWPELAREYAALRSPDTEENR